MLVNSALVRDDLLGSQCAESPTSPSGSQSLVQRVRVQRLRSAEHRCQGLQCNTHDVVVGLLRCQGAPGRLRMDPQIQRTRDLERWNRSFMTSSPDSPGRPVSWRSLRTNRYATLKKKLSRGAKSSTVSPARSAYSTYSMPSRRVNASSCSAVDPASRM